MVKIVALGGSLRPQSITYRTLELALKKTRERGLATEMIDLRTLRLPFCDGQGLYPDYPDVEVLRKVVQSAQGILLATPEYHAGISGVLKNALDLLDERHLRGKVAALIAVAGGVSSANAINAMRLVCRQLHCWVLPDQLIVPYSQDSFNEKGEFKDSELEQRLENLVDHFIFATRKFT